MRRAGLELPSQRGRTEVLRICQQYETDRNIRVTT